MKLLVKYRGQKNYSVLKDLTNIKSFTPNNTLLSTNHVCDRYRLTVNIVPT